MLHTLTRSRLAVTYFTTLIAIAFLAFGPLEASAQIYKWVDKNGTVTFGTQPPESTPAQRVTVDTYVPPTPSTTDEKADDKDTGKTDKKSKEKNKKKAAKPKKPAKPEMSAAQMRALCQQARNDLASLQTHGQMRQKDAHGNVSYMTDEQKRTREYNDNQMIRRYCR